MDYNLIPIPDITEEITYSFNQYKSVVTVSIITAILLLVTLAWNSVIDAIIKTYYPPTDDTLMGKLQYAFVITFIVIMLQIFVFPYFIDDTKNKKC